MTVFADKLLGRAKAYAYFTALLICGGIAFLPILLFVTPFFDGSCAPNAWCGSDSLLILYLVIVLTVVLWVILKANAGARRNILAGAAIAALVALVAGRLWPYSPFAIPHVLAPAFGFDGEAAEDATSFEYYFEIWLILAVASAAVIWAFRKLTRHR